MAANGVAVAGQRAILARYGATCKTTPNWILTEGDGERTFTQQVQFNPPDTFVQKPTVFCGLSLIDVVGDADYRLAVDAVNVTRTGLNLVTSTWHDSHVWSAYISWVAFESDSSGMHANTRMFAGRMSFKNTLPQYGLQHGNGPRSTQQPLTFALPFANPPSVVPALALIDLLRARPPNVSTRATAVSNDKCAIELCAQGSSQVRGATCAWLAYGKPREVVAAAPVVVPPVGTSAAPAAAMANLSITQKATEKEKTGITSLDASDTHPGSR